MTRNIGTPPNAGELAETLGVDEDEIGDAPLPHALRLVASLGRRGYLARDLLQAIPEGLAELDG